MTARIAAACYREAARLYRRAHRADRRGLPSREDRRLAALLARAARAIERTHTPTKVR